MSFDALAPHYDWMECLLAGENLHTCRTAYLTEVPRPRNILLAGEGHGRCLVECVRQFRNARIVYLDASEGMINQARRRMASENAEAANVEFIKSDIFGWSPPGGVFDLIITNFFLDCFNEDQIGKIIPRLAAAATQQAHWLLADFQVARSGMKRIRSLLILWSMYLFFRAATKLSAKKLTKPDAFLTSVGFNLNKRIEKDWGLLHSDWWTRSGAQRVPTVAGRV